MTKKQSYHHGDLRQALLKAALTLLASQDSRTLSLRAVAREAGVSHAAPYRHFEDKAALLAAVAEEGFSEFAGYLQAAVLSVDGEPVAALKATGIAYVRYALDHPTHFRVMFSSTEVLQDEKSPLYQLSKGTFQVLVDVIAAGQAAGKIKAGDPEFLALEKWSMVHGLATLLLERMIWDDEQDSDAIALTGALVQENMQSLLLPGAISGAN